MTIFDQFEVQLYTSFCKIPEKSCTHAKMKERKNEKYFKNINLPCEEVLDISFGGNESLIYANNIKNGQFGNNTNVMKTKLVYWWSVR